MQAVILTRTTSCVSGYGSIRHVTLPPESAKFKFKFELANQGAVFESTQNHYWWWWWWWWYLHGQLPASQASCGQDDVVAWRWLDDWASPGSAGYESTQDPDNHHNSHSS